MFPSDLRNVENGGKRKLLELDDVLCSVAPEKWHQQPIDGKLEYVTEVEMNNEKLYAVISQAYPVSKSGSYEFSIGLYKAAYVSNDDPSVLEFSDVFDGYEFSSNVHKFDLHKDKSSVRLLNDKIFYRIDKYKEAGKEKGEKTSMSLRKIDSLDSFVNKPIGLYF